MFMIQANGLKKIFMYTLNSTFYVKTSCQKHTSLLSYKITAIKSYRIPATRVKSFIVHTLSRKFFLSQLILQAHQPNNLQNNAYKMIMMLQNHGHKKLYDTGHKGKKFYRTDPQQELFSPNFLPQTHQLNTFQNNASKNVDDINHKGKMFYHVHPQQDILCQNFLSDTHQLSKLQNNDHKMLYDTGHKGKKFYRTGPQQEVFVKTFCQKHTSLLSYKITAIKSFMILATRVKSFIEQTLSRKFFCPNVLLQTHQLTMLQHNDHKKLYDIGHKGKKFY